MIDSIEITNWKTHKNTKLSFQKGVNVLIGVMGAGKSSAIDAISFGLFGTFPALKSRRITLDELITNRPSLQSEATIRLSFSVDNDSYVVIRKIGGSGAGAKLEKNGSHLQTQPTKVTEEIQAILKIDYDTFARVVYAEQNRLDYFLEMSSGERKREIDHMLGLDIFATAEENVTSLINKIRSTAGTEEEALQRTDISTIRQQLKKLSEESETLNQQHEELKKQEKSIRSELDDEKKKHDTQKKQLAAKKVVSDEIVKLQSRVNTIKEEIKKIETLKIDEKTIKDKKSEMENNEKVLKKELEDLKTKEKTASNSLSELKSEIKHIEEKISTRDKLLEQVKGEDESKTKKEIDQETGEIKELSDQIASKNSKVKELNEWIKELNKHVSKCPVCERELDEDLKKKLLGSKNETIEMLLNEIKDAEKDHSTKSEHLKKTIVLQTRLLLASSRLVEFKDVEKMSEKALKERKEAQKALEDATDELQKRTKAHESMKEELNELNNQMQAVERKKNYESEIEKTASTIDVRKKEFEGIDVDEKAMYTLQEGITKLSADLADAASKLESNVKYISNLELQIKEKGSQVKEFETIEKKIAKKQSQVNNLNKFKTALVDTETILRNRLVSSINGLMQSLWPQLYPYGDYTNIRLNAKKDDYLLEVHTSVSGGESWIQVDGIASGGERSIGSLTMRIALAMVIVPNLKWLILDEPTHNIDSTGIAKLIEVLSEELPNVVEQIFIITHDDNLKQISAAKVYQLERDKAAAAPTSVSEL